MSTVRSSTLFSSCASAQPDIASSCNFHIQNPKQRLLSPTWENGKLGQDGECNMIQSPSVRNAFIFKHRLPSEKTDKRSSQRKKGNLDKFLTSVQKSARLSQFDQLPFRKLSSSKKFQGILNPEDPPSGYFQHDFEIIERLGFGDFAEVFKAKWKKDGLTYAVKRSISRFGSCFENERPIKEQLRWMDEAFYHSAVSGNPNVVECVQSWEEAGYFHIQMEYLPERLDNFAARCYPLSETALWDVLTDLLSALEHLHGSGYIHLDIKPENIFLDEFGVTKLGDFGLITMLESDQKKAGDSRYMPMEALASDNLGFAVDIFSLGITMLELCTDIHLESHGPQWRSLREIDWPPEVIHRIPFSMRYIVRQMMSKDPRLRPSAASLLRLTPFRLHAIRRKAHNLNIPFLRLKGTASAFLKSTLTLGTHWMTSFLRFSSTRDSADRPVTPDVNLNYIDYAMKYDFTASHQPHSEEDSFVSPIVDSEDTPDDIDDSNDHCGKDDAGNCEEQGIFSKRFAEMLDSECELEMKLKLELFEPGNSVTRNLLDELSLISDEEIAEDEVAESPIKEFAEKVSQVDELNKVQILPDVVDIGRDL